MFGPSFTTGASVPRAKKTTSKKTNRGSPEAIAKRRAARKLNDLFASSGATGSMDGRTLKRKQRLMDELAKGKSGKPLKALDVLNHAHELLSLGETLTSLRKLKPTVPAAPDRTEEAESLFLEAQKLYGFDPKAWKLLGVDIEKLTSAPSSASTFKTTRRRR